MRTAVGLVAAGLLLTCVASNAPAQNKFSGTKMCAACHRAGKGGTQYASWEKTAHAKAYQTLLSEQAKKIATDKGLTTAPAESEACLKCHVPGGGKATNVEVAFKKDEGVTCEACHGAASGYKMIHSKGDLAASKAAGLVEGDKTGKACEACHNAESPTFKGFKYDEMWPKIAHGKQ